MLLTYYLPDNRGIVTVLNDGLSYPLGTKERVARAYVEKKRLEGYSEFVYSSSAETAGGYALAKAAKEAGLKATLFLVGTRLPPQGQELVSPDYHNLVTIYIIQDSMWKAEEEADQYVSQDPRRLKVPFGVNDRDYTDLLRNNFLNDPEVMSLNGRRIWIAVGSGTILLVLLTVLPQSSFLAVQVGKKIPDFLVNDPRVTVYLAPEKFTHPARIPAPWRSRLSNYDSKIWQFVLRHGQQGDAIWVVV